MVKRRKKSEEAKNALAKARSMRWNRGHDGNDDQADGEMGGDRGGPNEEVGGDAVDDPEELQPAPESPPDVRSETHVCLYKCLAIHPRL